MRAADDSSVVSDQWQRRFLGDLNQATFESLFGINHERLSQAGEEIRTGKGTLGELLFAAGAGLAGLRRAQQTLQHGLDDLFKPRAQNPRINKALTELEILEKELEATAVDHRGMATARRCPPGSACRCGTIQGTDPKGSSRVWPWLTRIKSAIPLVARRRHVSSELKRLGDSCDLAIVSV